MCMITGRSNGATLWSFGGIGSWFEEVSCI